MSLVNLAVITAGLTAVSWILIVAVDGDQPVERLVILAVGWLCVVWGVELA